jgi:AcrR family transcriptional regulator
MSTLNKPDLLAAMAAHVRAHGLAGASLRPLARAAGTSDRMLIYHFGSKDALIAALLDQLTAEILSACDAALPARPAATEAATLAAALALWRTPTFRPYLRVWFDILSGAARGEAAHAAAARRIAEGQLGWIAGRLPAAAGDRAAGVLVALQGALVLDAAGLGGVADDGIAQAYPAG